MKVFCFLIMELIQNSLFGYDMRWSDGFLESTDVCRHPPAVVHDGDPGEARGQEVRVEAGRRVDRS